ncbi:uncharacterized protein IL334_005869 [Kwoniella shivajii]|uniref:FAS1 domain-containing protein n=1 Tax=Kwoniella shivajii TaxID=564305 RepID=A0ABZ1D4C1_9TREE|nr:hypothetical protein IL334_005869 [Kwoniella shivajii]
MWSPSLIISVVLTARLGFSQQLAFSGSSSDHFSSASIASTFPSKHHDGDISTTAETIVSALSSSSEHTITLHLLQRSKCIPLLAHIGNATFFAPTDQAWNDWADKHKSNTDEPENDDGRIVGQGWLGKGGLEEWMKEEEEVLQIRTMNTEYNEEYEKNFMDNQNWALRQHLLYHTLNYTLTPSDLSFNKTIFASGTTITSNISVETTLLFPLDKEPELPPTPEPGAPWLPKGGEGLLHGHGQRLRIAKIGSEQGGERGKIGLDWNGDGGADIWDGKGWEIQGNQTAKEEEQAEKKHNEHQKSLDGLKWTRNGVVVGIEGVLDMPPSIEEIIRTHPSLQYLSHLLTFNALPSPLPDSFATSPHLTIFAPSNDAITSAFDDIEKGYLEGPFGEEGVGRILAGGVVLGIGKDNVGWTDTFSRKNVEASSGLGLQLVSDQPGHLSVNGTEAEAVDIFASNGVIHIVPNLLLPENFTLLNSAEKVLLSLNATRFVSLLRSANLSEAYIGPSRGDRENDGWTILAPTDEVMDMMDKWGSAWGAPVPEMWSDYEPEHVKEMEVPVALTQYLKKPTQDPSAIAGLLQYHILPGRLLPSDIKDGMLLGTELRTSALKGNRQRLRVDVSERLQNDPINWEAIGEGEIRFGGTTVLGKPVKTGNSIIYLLSSLLSPPDDVLQTAVSDLQLSTFIAAVYAAELNKAVKRTPATTYFMPRNRAFNQLGLTMKYLLLPEGKDELRKVIKYHAVNETIYLPEVETGKKVYKTLEGGSILLDRTKGMNGSISLRSPVQWEGHDSGDPDSNLPSNGELRSAKIWHSDALTNTGVIHTIDSVILPSDVKITIAKLIRGSKQSTMGELMIKAGLSWILEGREPTSDEITTAKSHGILPKHNIEEDDNNGDSSKGDESPGKDIEDLALPSYTVLVPTDKAFSRLNITHYLNHKESLVNLLKLHIIPSTSSTRPTSSSSSNTKKAIEPPKDGQPLSIDDDLIYSTLLSDDKKKFGDLAFRATGDNSFIVGIKGARGNAINSGNSARIGQSGRASVRWKTHYFVSDLEKKRSNGNKDKDVDEDDSNVLLWKDGMTLGGGVMMIDNVLIPYQPSWFSRWGWLVITLSAIGIITLIAAITMGWWFMTRGKNEEAEYEPLEGEEEE